MKLQIALDFINTLDEAEDVINEILPYADIIEIGTPLLMELGLEAVSKIKLLFPEKTLLADLKIADAGYYEAKKAFDYGADIVTVLAQTEDETIINVLRAANEEQKKVMVDMLAVKDLSARIQDIDLMGVNYICLHTSKDLQRNNQDIASTFKSLSQHVRQAELAIAGGINEANIEKYAGIKPGIVIVGEGITKTTSIQKSAKNIKMGIEQNTLGAE